MPNEEMIREVEDIQARMEKPLKELELFFSWQMFNRPIQMHMIGPEGIEVPLAQ